MLSLNSLDVYYGVIPSLRNLSLQVKEGQIVGLIGANGSGKTTTLNTVMGIVRPRRGNVLYGGRDITDLPVHERVRAGISLIPEGRLIFSRLTVKENLALGSYYRKDKEVRKDLNKIYDLFPILKERQKQTARFLSGGEQQMLALGRGLMNRPKLLLLDEPSLGMAPKLVMKIYESIKKIKEEGVTMLLVEQNVAMAAMVSDYMYVMEGGTIKLCGDPRDVISGDDVKKAYLGS